MGSGNGMAGEPATVIATRIRRGEADPVEVVRAHLAAIETGDAGIRAFRRVRAGRALEEAAALSGRPDLGALALAGVPIAVKDNVCVAGEPVRSGSAATPGEPCAADHEVVRRLRAAGAIIVGITNAPELCIWATTDGAWGATCSPWSRARTAGGSSGGSAAAVAAGMVPVAHGNDGLGSIRIPAACCGLVGLKPGTGVVPSNLGATSWNGMAENGPLATTVDDAALLFSVMADRPDVLAAEPSAPLRIAISTRAPLVGTPVDREYRAAVEALGERLARDGHAVDSSDPPYTVRNVLPVLARWFAGAADDAEGLPADRLEPRTRRHVRAGRIARRRGLVRPADAERWRRAAGAFFERHDVLITPALAAPPIAAAAWSRRSWLANVVANTVYAPFAAPWNLAGFPAMAVPAGRHSVGVPLSVQLVAGPGGEPKLLGLARHIERVQPWPRHPPPAE